MRRQRPARSWIALTLLLLLLFVTATPLGVLPTAAAAAPLAASGDTVTLTLTNGPTFTYGDPTIAPKFTVTVVLAAKLQANYFLQTVVTLDSGQTFGNSDSPPPPPDGVTYTFHVDAAGTALAAGSRSATASFFNPETKATAQSSPVGFTVNQATPQLNCTLGGSTLLLSPSQTVTLNMTFDGGNPNAPVDWQHTTYTIVFAATSTEASTATYPNLTPDANDAVTIQIPAQIGRYEVRCTFNGTANFSAATASDYTQPVLISERNKLGTVNVYTNPSTLVPQQPFDLYIVFHAAPGLPTPDGYYDVRFGNMSTKIIPIGSDGTSLVHIAGVQLPNFNGLTNFFIDYQGDPYYDSTTLSFPLTNPPIPGAGGSSNGSGGSGGGTSSGSTSTPTAGAASTPTVQSGDNGTPSTTPTLLGTQQHVATGAGADAGSPRVGGGMLLDFLVGTWAVVSIVGGLIVVLLRVVRPRVWRR